MDIFPVKKIKDGTRTNLVLACYSRLAIKVLTLKNLKGGVKMTP